MNCNFYAFIQGGIGPDVWDRELKISAVDIKDALNQAIAEAEDVGGFVTSVEQNDWRKPDRVTDKSACTEILTELIARFERLGKSEDALEDSFKCWSTAHAMADDAKRALATIVETPTDPLDNAVKVVESAQKAMTDAERLQFWDTLRFEYCSHCGRPVGKDEDCHCWKDE